MSRALPAALLLLLAACQGDQAILQVRGPSAGHIRDLWWLYFAVLAAVWLLVTLAFAWAVWRGRRAAQREEDTRPALSADLVPPPGGTEAPARPLEEAGERRSFRLVALSTGASLVVLLVLLVATVSTQAALTPRVPPDALTIEVTGLQWWWRLRYQDVEPSRSFTTANELHIPVGRPVVLELTSADVIHSLWVPSLHGKRDLIPGQVNVLVLQADAPGVYRGQCAEFCGHGHARMSLQVVAESPEDFERWRKAQLQPARPPLTEEQRRGQHVFVTGPCAMCHTIRGTPAAASAGPELTHLRSRRTLAAGSLPNTRGHLAGWILNSQALKPGNRMPNISLPPEDLQALLAYLETLE